MFGFREPNPLPASASLAPCSEAVEHFLVRFRIRTVARSGVPVQGLGLRGAGLAFRAESDLEYLLVEALLVCLLLLLHHMQLHTCQPDQGFGFWVLGFGFRVSGLGSGFLV